MTDKRRRGGATERVASSQPQSKREVELPAPAHALKKRSLSIATADGKPIEVWDLVVEVDTEILSSWASRFRQHYCPDSEIDGLRAGTGLSRKEYLEQLIFPDVAMAPGPSVRSGDFAELLVADYVEYLEGFWVPRGRFADKAVRNESVKGVDIVGFRLNAPPGSSKEDTLLVFEAKAQLTAGKYDGRLQMAVDDSSKDQIRKAETLNATKRRLLRSGDSQGALTVQRFQNPSDRPYTYYSGAAAVLVEQTFDPQVLRTTVTTKHANASNLRLVVICGRDLMRLVHALYERAADEA